MTEKKERGKNFSEIEKEQFVNICIKYKDVIENKKIDKASVQEKNLAWEKITTEFNAIQTTGPREARTLKMLYDNLKRREAKMRELFKTGESGPYNKKITGLSAFIVSKLDTHFEPPSDVYDSSSTYNEEDAVKQVSEEIDINDEIVIPEPYNFEKETEGKESENSTSTVADINDKIAASNRIKLQHVYNKLSDISEKRTESFSLKAKLLQNEHEKKMKILETEQKVADVKLEIQELKRQNQLKKQKILDIQLQKLLQ